jgi:hypothetical protein
VVLGGVNTVQVGIGSIQARDIFRRRFRQSNDGTVVTSNQDIYNEVQAVFLILYSLNNMVFTMGKTSTKTFYIENKWSAVYGPHILFLLLQAVGVSIYKEQIRETLNALAEKTQHHSSDSTDRVSDQGL